MEVLIHIIFINNIIGAGRVTTPEKWDSARRSLLLYMHVRLDDIIEISEA